jgi:hypothetical protein
MFFPIKDSYLHMDLILLIFRMCGVGAQFGHVLSRLGTVAAQSTFTLRSLSKCARRTTRKARKRCIHLTSIVECRSSSNTDGNNYCDCNGVADRLLNENDALHTYPESALCSQLGNSYYHDLPVQNEGAKCVEGEGEDAAWGAYTS